MRELRKKFEDEMSEKESFAVEESRLRKELSQWKERVHTLEEDLDLMK